MKAVTATSVTAFIGIAVTLFMALYTAIVIRRIRTASVSTFSRLVRQELRQQVFISLAIAFFLYSISQLILAYGIYTGAEPFIFAGTATITISTAIEARFLKMIALAQP